MTNWFRRLLARFGAVRPPYSLPEKMLTSPDPYVRRIGAELALRYWAGLTTGGYFKKTEDGHLIMKWSDGTENHVPKSEVLDR